MTFRQFAFNNVIRSKRTYLAHFLSSTFAIMIFFTYALLAFHPNLQGDLAASSVTINTFAKSGLQISQGLIFFFSFFFILYSVSAFLKTRKKDFGILMLHGMSRSQLNKLVFIENIIIGIVSILTGITIGMAFSKFILIMSNHLLMIDKGLPFYMPFKAIGITFGAFFLLFLFISLFTSRLVNVEQLVELIKAEEKPKPEPKASLWLSLFALICMGLGYTAVFHSVNAIHYKDVKYVLFMMAIGVSFVVLGTYFLFTQLSVYVLRALKKRENIFFKKTNILTISDLVYQLKDNAKMFFMVTIISAVAFTAVGTCMGLGNSSMAESNSPFAFSYKSYNNPLEKEHLKKIESELNNGRFKFKQVAYSTKQSRDTLYNNNILSTVIKLSDYNKLAKAFGFEKESLKNENDSLVIPSRKVVNTKSNQNNFQLLYRDMKIDMHVNKILTPKELQDTMVTIIIVPDAVYNQMIADPENHYFETTINGFIVKDWEKTKKVAENLLAAFQKDNTSKIEDIVDNGKYTFSTLILKWIVMKQSFGLASIMSVLIGIVFFTFAASFLYFRLYTDLERNQQQYKMIAKVGLSKLELKKIVSRQLVLLFFLPIVIAITHSVVAFMALQKLANFSVLGSSIIVLVCFLVLQIIYFYFVRTQYLKKMYKTII
ncbi:ABC transporter permease [Bacillus cereus group sp. BfR-BA-01382]|uniref:FtsX-like permease family protein n=1 Tax=Bacillus cereus group sp. BfR-BA-01382 TaxID=2920326 RepID=UPI001F563D02